MENAHHIFTVLIVLQKKRLYYLTGNLRLFFMPA